MLSKSTSQHIGCSPRVFPTPANRFQAILSFLSVIWLPHGRFWDIIEERLSLIWRWLLRFYIFPPKGHWELRNEIGSLSPSERLFGRELGSFQFWSQWHNSSPIFIGQSNPTATRFAWSELDSSKEEIQNMSQNHLKISVLFLSDHFHSSSDDFDIKGTVMQIEKALINDRLYVSRTSSKFRIPTIYYFGVIYPWNLLFS